MSLDAASTEPPSEDGGESKLATDVNELGSRLQRSRRPKTAERDRRQRFPGRHRVASTEPPSEDGGEVLHQLRLSLVHKASTEPPSEDGGELPPPSAGDVAVIALQ